MLHGWRFNVFCNGTGGDSGDAGSSGTGSDGSDGTSSNSATGFGGSVSFGGAASGQGGIGSDAAATGDTGGPAAGSNAASASGGAPAASGAGVGGTTGAGGGVGGVGGGAGGTAGGGAATGGGGGTAAGGSGVSPGLRGTVNALMSQLQAGNQGPNTMANLGVPPGLLSGVSTATSPVTVSALATPQDALAQLAAQAVFGGTGLGGLAAQAQGPSTTTHARGSDPAAALSATAMNAIFGDAISAVNSTAQSPFGVGGGAGAGQGGQGGIGSDANVGVSTLGDVGTNAFGGSPGVTGTSVTANDVMGEANMGNVSTASLGAPGSVGPGGIGSDANFGTSTYGDMSDVTGFGGTQGVGDPGAKGSSAVGAQSPGKTAVQAVSIANQSSNPTATINAIVDQAAKTMSPSEFSTFMQQLSNFGYGSEEGQSQGAYQPPNETAPRDPSGTYFDYLRQNQANQGLGL